ncbi:MAG: hypothetical protein ACD_76C00161G0011 [uncultured bacterium]|nr:MAG: hypothetical protein ACD_76C00161G0011 [uncultured bacterium]HBD05405.1 cytidine deaminase [Candidatus Uhrbacteria bacterium]
MTTQKREHYLSWDECFMHMAHLMSERSKDPNTQAGAVIVNPENIVVGLGYNGWPRGIHDDKLPWGREGSFLETKYAYVVHAEANAVYNSNAPVSGCKIYVTLFPCNECAKAIIQNGIREVVFASDKYADQDVFKASRNMLALAGINLREYIPQYKLKLNGFPPHEDSF